MSDTLNGQSMLTTFDSREYDFGDFQVQSIDQRAAEIFVTEYHYSKGMGNAALPYGLFDQSSGQLLGVIAFHTPISENVRASIFGGEHKHRVTELHRMAIHPEAPHNTATWFISRALDGLKEDKPKYWAVISMADSTEGHDGTVYQAANADYYGTTGKATFYYDEDERLRSPRQCGENISKEDAERRGWEPVQRAEKHRYVFWLPDEYQSKDDLREKTTIELQPYP